MRSSQLASLPSAILAAARGKFIEVLLSNAGNFKSSRNACSFGYIDFASPDLAKKAVETMQGKEVDGRAIKLDFSTPRQPKEAGGFQQREPRKNFGNGEASAPSNTLFVGNLSFGVVEDSVWEYFAEFGPVSSVRLPKDPETERPKGFGYVEFTNQEDATKAFEQNGSLELDGRTLRIDYSGPKPQREGGAFLFCLWLVFALSILTKL